jgi:hypothetical protein
MGQVAGILISAGKFSITLAETMLKDIKPAHFARKPSFDCTGGPKVIDTNHPAFVYGHLSIYPARLLQILGADSASLQNPPGYEDLFSAGKECRDDPDGTIYPSMESITGHFFTGHRAALAAIEGVGDDRFAAPNPREGRIREMFPTVGGMANFMLATHVMMHLGQISAWRRCMGLGSAM